MLEKKRKKKKKKKKKKTQLYFVICKLTDVLDKQSHTVTYMQTHSHPLTNRNLWSKKAVQSEKDLSIHSISVTEVLERPFSSDRTLSRDTLLPSLESNQRFSDLAFTFFPPYLLCSKWWKRRENKGWYHRRHPCKCQAQGMTCFNSVAQSCHITHPEYLEVCRWVTDWAAHNRSEPSREGSLCNHRLSPNLRGKASHRHLLAINVTAASRAHKPQLA